jgi:hypothetical protein
MQDMRCPRNTFLKHFIMPDDELKKKGYAVDKLDESIISYINRCVLAAYLIRQIEISNSLNSI